MPGRRWSDGFTRRLKRREGVKVEHENQTLATITFQNYFRMYKKLAGMTGTAETEASEFDKIYKLEVVVIPTNRKMFAAGEIPTLSTAPRRKSIPPPPMKFSNCTTRGGRSWWVRLRLRSRKSFPIC